MQMATVEIVDIAGLVKGASNGEGLGNKFLANIRETNAIIHVLRCFDDDNIVHVDGSVNPVRDKEVIDTELQLKDLESIENKLEKVKRTAKTGNKESKKELEVLRKYKNALENGISARAIDATDEELSVIKDMMLLTEKPVLYLCNVDEASVKKGNKYVEQIQEIIKNEKAEILTLSASTESDIADLEDYEEKQMFLEELGLDESGVNRLIRKAYNLLDLQTYFTAGIQEVRAWTIKKGFTAPRAAGVIHTDFEKGFIRAEVIKYQDYVKYGSENACRESGKLSVEGKDYVVQDGDVMHFRFNV